MGRDGYAYGGPVCLDADVAWWKAPTWAAGAGPGTRPLAWQGAADEGAAGEALARSPPGRRSRAPAVTYGPPWLRGPASGVCSSATGQRAA